MSEPVPHNRPKPRALFELALCIMDGGAVDEGARASGLDPELAEVIAGYWAFRLLVRLLPLVLGPWRRRRSSAGKPRSERQRSAMWKAAEPVVSRFAEEEWSLEGELRHLRRRRAEASREAEASSDDTDSSSGKAATPRFSIPQLHRPSSLIGRVEEFPCGNGFRRADIAAFFSSFEKSRFRSGPCGQIIPN
ncbi:MAG: hypothetical protein R3C97_09985 [Geminicoccaceae bacterium]